MKRLFLTLVSTLAVLVLPGCLQNETTIHLNKDGSGTLVEETTLGTQMMAMMGQMSVMGGKEAKDPLAEMFSAEKAKAKAATLGEGVTFEKSEPLEAGGNRGARTTYHFTDINKLTISPAEQLQKLSPMATQVPVTAKHKPIAFSYAAGTLTITMPKPDKPAADAPKPPAAEAPQMPNLDENPQAEVMMKQMLGDMKVAFKLVIEPGIAETDATHRDGNTITLMQMEMGKLLEKAGTFKKLSAAPKNDPAAALELIQGIDGMKMESKPQVTVKLK